MKKIYVPKAFKTTIEVWTSYDPRGSSPEEILSGPTNITRVTHTEVDKYVALHEVLAAQGVRIHFEEDPPTREEVVALRNKYPRGD